jgi:hypothetical protein
VLACHGERALEPAELFHEADVPRLAPDPPRPSKSGFLPLQRSTPMATNGDRSLVARECCDRENNLVSAG